MKKHWENNIYLRELTYAIPKTFDLFMDAIYFVSEKDESNPDRLTGVCMCMQLNLVLIGK